MYKDHFKLDEEPFSIAPDPRFLYMTERHREALAHLLYGLKSGGGFVLLTGEVGTGKTTVCRSLIEQAPKSADVAFILNPKLTVEELLETVCEEFGIELPANNRSIKVFVERINTFLLDAHGKGRTAVLIIDEAQNLSADVLEQMRLLTNLETSKRKLLHIVLIGHPELKDKLAAPELRQLAQRIIARYDLGPLTREEVAGYIKHRLSVAGGRGMLFPDDVVAKIARLSGGIPRLVNLLCDRALLGAYSEGKDQVTGEMVARAATEVFGREPAFDRRRRVLLWSLGLGAIAASTIAIAVVRQRPTESLAVVPSSSPQPKTLEPPVVPSPPAAKATQPPDPLATPLATPLDWPVGEPIARSELLAWRALFRAWNLPAPRGAPSPCEQAADSGLRCFSESGGLAALRRDDRPAVVQLRGAGGQTFVATVLSLDDRFARIVLGTTPRTIATAELAAAAFGNYTLLWRMPPSHRATVAPGTRGPTVDWLVYQLSVARGERTPPITGRLFDAALTAEVKQFQLGEGTNPDGVVGPQTLIRLANAAGTNEPRLMAQNRSDQLVRPDEPHRDR